MMNERDALSLIAGVPWCLPEDALDRLGAKLRAAPALPTAKQLAQHRDESMSTRGKQQDRVCVIGIHGTISQWPDLWSWLDNGTSTEAVGAQLDHALRDPSVSSIVLHFDTPGGGVFGLGELGDRIFEARRLKPILGMVDSLCASAGYWLAAQCSSLIATPGGDVGSVGVYALHADLSQALADAGVKVSIIKAGRFKAEGNPFQPLSAEGRDYLQQQVNETYSTFIRAVARGRGKLPASVAANFGEGRLLSADRARAVGMVDEVLPFGKLLAKLAGQGSNGRQAKTAMPARPPSGSPAMQKLRREQAARNLERLRLEQKLRKRGAPLS